MNSDLSVLIVDDDPTSLRLLQAILGEVGFRVTITDQPRAALRHINDEPPDILVTDLRMPDMNGVELVEAVHALDRGVYCVVVTGFASDDVTADVYRAGARDLLLKPINVAEVQARMRNAAELVRLRRELRLLRTAQTTETTSHAPGPVSHTAPRAHELADLPVLPGSAGPVDAGGRDESLTRLERLASLYRQGIIDATEFENRKRALLARL